MPGTFSSAMLSSPGARGRPCPSTSQTSTDGIPTTAAKESMYRRSAKPTAGIACRLTCFKDQGANDIGGQPCTGSHTAEGCWASWNTVRSLACRCVLVANGSAVPRLRPYRG